MDGVYTTKSGYRWLMGLEENNEPIKQWSWLWNLQVPQRVVVFLWLVCRSALPTNSMRCQRRATESDICSRCNVMAETILHCLRDCPKAACVWEAFGIISNNEFWIEIDPYEWLYYGVKNYPLLFAATVWWIWKARCGECMAGKVMSLQQTQEAIGLLIDDLLRIFPTNTAATRVTRQVAWISPNEALALVKEEQSHYHRYATVIARIMGKRKHRSKAERELG
ncbi:hypothetical protein RIF29_00647 [Crotalaria pallida]|uniref:Reverse transcriptase zinc-binding domain-containing protein n=1 Tax=Crotalaria pallida TaxID=3830 RepID=A0AAN9P7K3_CROPI